MQRPLDASNYLKPKQVCKILDVDQLHQTGFRQKPYAEPEYEAGLADTCSYGTDDAGLAISFDLSNKNGLSAIYAERSTMSAFEPTSVQGYPAVNAAPTSDRTDGRCQIHVGINDHMSFFSDYVAKSSRTEAQPCEKSKKAASLVITSLIKYPTP